MIHVTWTTRSKRAAERLNADQIVLSELDHQVEDNSQRQANMIARVSIAIAANAVALVPLFADGLDVLRSWPGVLWVLPLAPAVLSIVFGFKSIDLWSSRGPESTRDEVAIWRTAASAQVIDRLILDRLDVLETVRADLARKTAWHRRSVVALTWTGIVMVLVFIFTSCIGAH